MTIMMELARHLTGLLAGIDNSRSPAKLKLDVIKGQGAALDVAEASSHLTRHKTAGSLGR
jgi:hypothetical protein